jgi:RimJ/RimL family protein N-acetyltransferase
MAAPVLVEGAVTLRPLQPGDRADRQRHGWWASVERGYGHTEVDRPMTEAEADAWLTAVSDHATDTWWVMEADGAAVGVAFLHSFEGSRARYAVGLFGPALQGRGLGSAATRAVLRHAFDDLGLEEVDLRVLEFNEPAIRCYEACGFVATGREVASCELDGELYDDIVMTARRDA